MVAETGNAPVSFGNEPNDLLLIYCARHYSDVFSSSASGSSVGPSNANCIPFNAPFIARSLASAVNIASIRSSR